MLTTQKLFVGGLVLAVTALIGSTAQADVFYVAPGWQEPVYSQQVIIQPVRIQPVRSVVARRVVVAQPVYVPRRIAPPAIYAQPVYGQPVYVASKPEFSQPVVISRSVLGPDISPSYRVRERTRSLPNHYRHTYKVDRR